MAGDKRPIDEVSGSETTGHEWDGIRELDTPLPRWWLYIFYATIVIAVIYWVLMPAWPMVGGYTRGILNFSDRANVAADIRALQQARAPTYARLRAAGYDEIIADPQMSEFARAAGESMFGDNCRTCHAAGGAGTPGYPNLADDVWLWGGSLGEIEHTIRVGVRAEHPQTRQSAMPAYGRDRLLNARQIADVTEYALSLNAATRARERPDMNAAARGAVIFAEQCTLCHGATGAGDRTQGAPSLTDNIWIYGGARAEVRRQIEEGRNGVMPTWEARFDDGAIRALAIYVYSLGGGEPEAAPAPPEPTAAP